MQRPDPSRADGLDDEQQPKRVPHKRVTTGCKTCRTRKLRCDEQKPACRRCSSTGRKCDGYAVAGPPDITPRPTGHGLVVLPSPKAVALLPQFDKKELRSFEYFLEVTAPALAGVFDIDFWVRDIPRACHSDPAVWHAVVGLAAVSEDRSPERRQQPLYSRPPSRQMTLFALQQLNLSIRRLLQSPAGDLDQWRTLTTSVIFTCAAAVQGHQRQALTHLKAGQALLRGLRAERAKPSWASSVPGPTSLDSVQGVINRIDVQARAFAGGGHVKHLRLLADIDSFTAWRYYKAPEDVPGRPRHGLPLCASPANLACAGRAFEALLNGMVASSQEQAAGMAALLTGSGGAEVLESLVKSQEPFARAYAELSAAIRLFSSGAGAAWRPSSAVPPAQHTAMLTLLLYQATLRACFLRDPESSEVKTGENDAGPGHFPRIVDLSEQVLRHVAERGRASLLIPMPTTTSPLFLVAHSGFPQSARRDAISVMKRYPRREGIWDNALNADIAELCLDREGTGDATPPPMARIHDMRLSFEEDGSIKVILRNWDEWFRGAAGIERVVPW